MIKKCVIPAAGMGTRFLPITKSIPKEMLPVGNIPLIEHTIRECYYSGLSDFLIIKNKEKQSLEKYFHKNSQLDMFLDGKDKLDLIKDLNFYIDNCNFSFINQKEMLGLGDAILHSRNYVDGDSFVVLLPDDLCYSAKNPVIKQLISIHEKYPDFCIVAVEEVESSSVSSYGIISGEKIEGHNNLFLVNKMIEKPSIDEAPSNLAIIGRYLFSPKIFDYILKTKTDHNGEIQITNALNFLAKENKVLAYIYDGKRYDCGEPQGYLKANNFYIQQTFDKL